MKRLLFFLALLAAAALAQTPATDLGVSVGKAESLRTLKLLVEGSRTVDWAPRGDKIAYDRVDGTGYSRLYIANPDGTGESCITCLPLGFRKRHAGNPAWHPSGRYIVFQLEKPFRRRGEPLPFMAVPGRNLGDDLWAITPDGKRFWNLTQRAELGGRSLSPRFSAEGDWMVWSERIAAGCWILSRKMRPLFCSVPPATGANATSNFPSRAITI